MQIADYTVQETLHQGKRFIVYRAMAEDDKTPCILKMLNQTYQGTTPGTKAIEHEYQLLSQIDSEHVIKASKHLRHNKYAFIVLEDIQGKDLKTFLENNPPFSPGQFLELALAMTNGLAAIHQHNIIHKDINPSNILWNSQTGSLKIIDFDIASKFDVKVSYLGNPERLEGTLPYISPEQTGRMNRRVDQRSDLYSLGVTFYEMLTGKRPFGFRDPMEMVHAHLAKMPVPPCELPLPSGGVQNLGFAVGEADKEPAPSPSQEGKGGIEDSAAKSRFCTPKILSDIIMKLLAKAPEDRYQSAEGLKYDLEQVQKATLPGFGTLAGFTLATKDFSGKLQIPEKLYGRQQEIEQLLSVYQRVSQGGKEMVLVAGYSGTGKTSLVNEIHTPITKDRGYFISGKFDQLQRTIPYFAFIQALNHFCELLLTERQEVLAQRKEDILQAVGTLGKVLTDMIPQLETVIGTQPDVPDVGGEEAQRRFNYVFQRFLRAISTEEHPLVMFLDDLQWADLASLSLLQALMEDTQNRYFLFIGAYRDNEVSPSHPLMATLEEIQKHDMVVHTIPVKDLSLENVQEWLGDTLNMGNGSGQAAVTPLAGLIYQKTRGNAFFTIQFLHNLYEEKLLSFDSTQSTWTWDITEIEKQNITDNVVDLLARKIQTLPAEGREVLRLAACIGNRFDLSTLSVISETGKEEQEKNLETALIANLIYPVEDDVYKFVHDRIRQAAYSLIAEKNKQPLHLKIGRLLLKTFEEIEPHLFEIVNHLNIGIDLIGAEQEKIELAQLNLRAGHKARTSAAYQQSSDYLRNAMGLLPADPWQNQYQLTYSIYNEAIQTAYLCGEYEEMQRFVDILLQFVREETEKATAYEHILMSLMAQNQVQKAVENIVEIFTNLGINIPNTCGKLRLIALFMTTKLRLKGKRSETLKQLPPMTVAKARLAMRFYLRSATILYLGAQSLYPYIITKLVLFVLKYGMAAETANLFSEYGVINSVMGDVSEAYRFGQLALELLEQTAANDIIKARTHLLAGAYILCWKEPYHDVGDLFLKAYHYALNAGDFELAGYLLTNHLLMYFLTDMDILTWREKVAAARETLTQLKQQIPLGWTERMYQFATKLCEVTTSPTQLDVASDSSAPEQPDAATPENYWKHSFQILLAYLFENNETLEKSIYGLEAVWEHQKGTIHFAEVSFFASLGRLRIAETHGTKAEQKPHLKIVRKVLKQLKKWASLAPANHQHRYDLLQAEFLRVTGKAHQIGDLYNKAIQSAHEHGFLPEEALANELAAKFSLQNKHEQLAEFYFQKALLCYRKWGATAKVKHLEEHYPKYIHPSTGREETTSTGTTSAQLDVKSILKASHTLSGEVQLTRLLEKMMQILIENAGAQRGVFIEQRGESFLIQAEGTADGVTGILQAVPVEESEKLPLAVINYVARSKEPLVFENITKDQNYSNDRYVQKHQPKSIVCFPVLKQTKLSGMIYLENNLVEGAFTPARLEVLNMLSTQIAISIENAELYETLEDRVRRRTLALQQAHEKLEKSHKNITDSVNYASRIQQAVLPTQELIAELFPEHFILYKPCAVVSGDFYWVKQLENTIVIAAVDCTGHGVSGALVSMLGTAFLNEIVPLLDAQSQLTAGNILNELRTRVKVALKQTGKPGEQKEGMDIALCILDPPNNQLHYAGAYNPLYIIRDRQLLEVKADRMPIGIHRRERPFSNHDFPFQRGDMLYLFTDGFVDQTGEQEIGGFSKKRFQQLLLDIHHEPVSKQKELLLRRFEAWKGNLPQTDDLLIVGIRL